MINEWRLSSMPPTLNSILRILSLFGFADAVAEPYDDLIQPIEV